MAALRNNVDGYHFQRNLLPLVRDKGFHWFADNHVWNTWRRRTGKLLYQ